MADLFLNESTIEDSFIYKSFNASNSVIEKLVKYIRTAAPLDSSYIEEQYMQIKRVSISPLSQKVIDAYDRGDIELLYSKTAKVGTSIPFIIRKNEKGKVVATIFIATFGTLDKTNSTLNIPLKQLYALMESAYVALQMQVNPMKIQRNVGIMKLCMSVYNQMIMRILNKEYSLIIDRELHDKVMYCVNRFFLEVVWGYPSKELIDSYSKLELKYIQQIDLDLIKDAYDSGEIKTIDDLMKFIKGLSPRMETLTTRYFIERFVNTFHGSSILAIDYLPYVFFVIINIILGSFLISQIALNDIIKNTKGMNKFYIELSKLV